MKFKYEYVMCDFYWWICDEWNLQIIVWCVKFTDENVIHTEKQVLVKKCLQMGQTWIYHTSLSWKDSLSCGNTDYPVKKKVLGDVVSKEVKADKILGAKKSYYYWFPWIRCNNE